MPEIRTVANDENITRCDAMWGEGLECPNEPEWLIVVTSKVGFAIMCDPHRQGFDEYQRGYDYTVEPYTQARAAELKQKVDETGAEEIEGTQ